MELYFLRISGITTVASDISVCAQSRSTISALVLRRRVGVMMVRSDGNSGKHMVLSAGAPDAPFNTSTL
jgi:hypothetical protein